MTSREYYWNPKNTEKCRAYARDYHNQHKEIRNAYTKEWRARNQDKVLLNKNRWYQENKDTYNTIRRENRNSNWEKMIEKERIWHSKWKLAHPEKVKEYRIDYSHRRRAKLSKDKCSVSIQDLREIKMTFKICPYCGKPATTFDHIYPLQPRDKNVKQGKHVKENIIRACISCNSSKNDKDPIQWCKEQNIKIPDMIKSQIKGVKSHAYGHCSAS
jgi:5-methylcytosine-specific restriction endonuclease McrA